MVAYLYNLSTGEAGVGRRTVSLRPAWAALSKHANKQATLGRSPDLPDHILLLLSLLYGPCYFIPQECLSGQP